MSLTTRDTEVVFETIESGRDERALPGTGSIGRGYNVFGGYIDPESTGQQLFDLGEYEKDRVSGYDKPERVQVQTYKKGDFEDHEGSTSRSYQEDLMGHVGLEGKYGFFQGEVEVEFDESHRRCSSFHFVSKTSRAYRYLLDLDPDPAEFLSERARADLAKRDPEYLFERYGTHYLNSLIIGACAVFSSATNTASAARSMDFSQTAELAYKAGVGSISVKEGSRQQKQIETFERNSKKRVRVRGGRPEFGQNIIEGDYQKWIDSIEENMDWVALPKDSPTRHPLIPIWELCDDDRRTEIEAYFHEEYAPKFKPESEPTIAPVYAYSVSNPRRWRYSLTPDLRGHGWVFHENPFFYVSTEPGEGDEGRVPVYMYSAKNHIRFKISTKEHESGPQGPWTNIADPDGWTGETNPVWYAYPPEAGRGDDRVPIEGHTDPRSSEKSGWFYSIQDDDRNWKPGGIAFYAEMVKLED